MTYKTCKILTRLKTAPHVSVARRMEPFAKHLLNLASWLEQLYPSQTQCLSAADCSLGLMKAGCLQENTALPWCFLTAVSAQPFPAVLHEGTALRAAAAQQGTPWFSTLLPATEDAPRASPSAFTTPGFWSPAPFSGRRSF